MKSSVGVRVCVGGASFLLVWKVYFVHVVALFVLWSASQRGFIWKDEHDWAKKVASASNVIFILKISEACLVLVMCHLY